MLQREWASDPVSRACVAMLVSSYAGRALHDVACLAVRMSWWAWIHADPHARIARGRHRQRLYLVLQLCCMRVCRPSSTLCLKNSAMAVLPMCSCACSCFARVLCAGALWPIPACVCRDVRSFSPFTLLQLRSCGFPSRNALTARCCDFCTTKHSRAAGCGVAATHRVPHPYTYS